MNDMISPGIQIQGRVDQGDCPANAEIAVFRPYPVDSPVNICPALRLSLLREQRQLRHLFRRSKGEASDRSPVWLW